MKNPMLALSTALICGAFLGVIIPDGYYLQILTVAILTTILRLLIFKKLTSLLSLLFFLAIIVMFITGLTRASFVRSENLFALAPLAKQNVTVFGEVRSIDVKNDTTYIEIATKSFIHENTNYKISTKVNLAIYSSSFDAKTRDVISASGILSLYEPMKFWGDLSEREYYASNGIFAKVVSSPYDCEVIGNAKRKIDLLLATEKIRASIQNTISKALSGDEAALLSGILIGDKHDFTYELKTAFQLSGLSHIIAISGLHIGIFILFISYSAWGFLSSRKWVATLIITAIFTYIAVTGASPSILRAGLMAIYGIIIENLKLRRDSHTALMASTALLCLYNPYLLQNTGFQLSFIATLGIILLGGKLFKYKIPNAGLAAFIFTLPLLAYSFNTITLSALITNIIVSPLVIMSLILGIIMSIIPYSWVIISPILFSFLHIMILVAKFFASISQLTIPVASPSLAMLILCITAIFIMYQIIIGNRKKTITIFALMLMLSLSVFNINSFITGRDNAVVTFIAMQSGDGVHIKTPKGHNILVDSGEGYDLFTFLKKKNIQKIDAVILTNFKKEDTNGLEYLLNCDFPISTIYLPSSKGIPSFAYKDDKSPNIIAYEQGDSFSLDEIKFDVVSYNEYAKTLSNSSSTIKMNCLGSSFLFMGDLDKVSEVEMIDTTSKDVFKSDVIRLGSHGLPTSTSNELIKVTNAKYAIANAGYNETARLSLDIENNLIANGATPLKTYAQGSISFEIGKDGIRSVNKTRIPNIFELKDRTKERK